MRKNRPFFLHIVNSTIPSYEDDLFIKCNKYKNQITLMSYIKSKSIPNKKKTNDETAQKIPYGFGCATVFCWIISFRDWKVKANIITSSSCNINSISHLLHIQTDKICE